MKTTHALTLLLTLVMAGLPVFAQTETAPTSRPPIPADTEIQTTASGLKYSILKPGDPNGKPPGPTSLIKINYSGWFTDGTPFDSSRGQPREWPLNRMIKGWIEGLQLMTPGAVFKFTVPPELAYGAAGRPGIPPNATLIFEVELLGVSEAPPPAPKPTPLPVPDLTPIDESKLTATASGLKYRVLKDGEGAKLEQGQQATFHYAAWLLDGTPVRSTYQMGKPAKERIGGAVVKGWNEGLALMKVGSTFQLVVPPNLAFGDRKMGNVPPGSTLVFHIELLSSP